MFLAGPGRGDEDGPKLTFVSRSGRRGAPRRTSHSLRLQNPNVSELMICRSWWSSELLAPRPALNVSLSLKKLQG